MAVVPIVAAAATVASTAASISAANKQAAAQRRAINEQRRANAQNTEMRLLELERQQTYMDYLTQIEDLQRRFELAQDKYVSSSQALQNEAALAAQRLRNFEEASKARMESERAISDAAQRYVTDRLSTAILGGEAQRRLATGAVEDEMARAEAMLGLQRQLEDLRTASTRELETVEYQNIINALRTQQAAAAAGFRDYADAIRRGYEAATGIGAQYFDFLRQAMAEQNRLEMDATQTGLGTQIAAGQKGFAAQREALEVGTARRMEAMRAGLGARREAQALGAEDIQRALAEQYRTELAATQRGVGAELEALKAGEEEKLAALQQAFSTKLQALQRAGELEQQARGMEAVGLQQRTEAAAALSRLGTSLEQQALATSAEYAKAGKQLALLQARLPYAGGRTYTGVAAQDVSDLLNAEIRRNVRSRELIGDAVAGVEAAKATTQILERAAATQRGFGQAVEELAERQGQENIALATRSAAQKQTIANRYKTALTTLAEAFGKEGVKTATEYAEAIKSTAETFGIESERLASEFSNAITSIAERYAGKGEVNATHYARALQDIATGGRNFLAYQERFARQMAGLGLRNVAETTELQLQQARLREAGTTVGAALEAAGNIDVARAVQLGRVSTAETRAATERQRLEDKLGLNALARQSMAADVGLQLRTQLDRSYREMEKASELAALTNQYADIAMKAQDADAELQARRNLIALDLANRARELQFTTEQSMANLNKAFAETAISAQRVGTRIQGTSADAVLRAQLGGITGASPFSFLGSLAQLGGAVYGAFRGGGGMPQQPQPSWGVARQTLPQFVPQPYTPPSSFTGSYRTSFKF